MNVSDSRGGKKRGKVSRCLPYVGKRRSVVYLHNQLEQLLERRFVSFHHQRKTLLDHTQLSFTVERIVRRRALGCLSDPPTTRQSASSSRLRNPGRASDRVTRSSSTVAQRNLVIKNSLTQAPASCSIREKPLRSGGATRAEGCSESEV